MELFLTIKYLQSVGYSFYNLLFELYRLYENGINVLPVILYQIELIRPSGVLGQDVPIVDLFDVVVGNVDDTSKGELVTLRFKTRYTKISRAITKKYLQLFTDQDALIEYKHVTTFNFLVVVSLNSQFSVFHQSTKI